MIFGYLFFIFIGLPVFRRKTVNPSNSAPSTDPDDVPMNESRDTRLTEVSFAELAKFARDEKYPKRWKRRHEGRSVFAGFNIWAFLFGVQWFFFRKLYAAGVVALMLECVLPILLIRFLVLIFSYSPLLPVLSLSFLLLPRVFIGIWANIALYKRAVCVIRDLNRMNLDNEIRLQQIAARGGVSIGGLLIGHLSYFVLSHLLF